MLGKERRPELCGPSAPSAGRLGKPPKVAAPAPAITRKPAKAQVAGKPPAVPRITKADIVIGLLARPAGATIAQMCEATGWQQHSVRGFLAGTAKKKPGVTLGSDKTDAGRIYRLTPTDAVPA